MVPLMVQQDYKPQGWLGLILGSRMWYAMWDAEKDDDAAFERRVDAVMREVGDRGKLVFSEAVTSSDMRHYRPAFSRKSSLMCPVRLVRLTGTPPIILHI